MQLFILLLFLILPGSAFAETPPGYDQNFVEWSANFYKHPEMERVVPSLHYYCNSGLSGDPKYRALTSHFYAALLRSDPPMADKLFDSVQSGASDRVKSFVLNTLWLVNTDHSRELLNRAKNSWTLSDNNKRTIDQSLIYRPQWPLDTPITSTDSIDLLWSIFSATGDERVVKKIISVLHFAEDGSGKELLIGGGARWSLKSQMGGHPRVVEIVKSEFESADERTRPILGELLK